MATRRFTGLALMVRTLSFQDYHVPCYMVVLALMVRTLSFQDYHVPCYMVVLVEVVVSVLNSDVSCVLFS